MKLRYLSLGAIQQLDVEWALQNIRDVTTPEQAKVILHQLRFEMHASGQTNRKYSKSWLLKNGQSRLYNLPWNAAQTP